MYSAHVLIFLFYCNICFVITRHGPNFFNMKPVIPRRVEISNNLDSLGRPSTFPINWSCMMLSPNISTQPVILYIDLLTNYPVHLIHFRGKTISSHEALVRIRLDHNNTKNVWFSGESKVELEPVLTGRVIEMSTTAAIDLCSVDVYTCTIGKTGKDCDEECADGYFGLSCERRCGCWNGSSCDKKTGVCPEGCQSDPSRVPKICYFAMVKIAPRDMVSISKTEVTSIYQGPTLDLKSSIVYNPSEQCFSVASQCSSKFLFIQLDLVNPIVLYGVEMTFTQFNLPAPFSIYVTSDGKPCFGFTSKINFHKLGTQVFKCQRQNTVGKHILIRFTTYNKLTAMNATGVGLHVCNLRALECSSGFYGQNCRQICGCAGNYCNKATGECFHRRCGLYSKGPYCSSIDVFPNTIISRAMQFDSRLSDLQTSTYSHPFLGSYANTFFKWLAVQFDGLYAVNGFTLTIPGHASEAHKSIQVFTDPRLSIVNLSIADFNDWPGLPCKVKEPEKGRATHYLSCPSLVKTLFLVIISDSVFLDVSAAKMKMWSCGDGLFGMECVHKCNCRDVSEICDKISGLCLSGCAQGYKGVDCMQVCVEGDRDPRCPTQTCHCLGDDQRDCGPGLALCSHGCQAGWMGVSCSLPCPTGFFGPNCEDQCGNCLYDNTTNIEGGMTCLPTNGTCVLGCASDSDRLPTCGSKRAASPTPAELGAQKYILRGVEDASVHIVLGLVAVISACCTLVILVCCSLKCYWDRVAKNKRRNEKRLELMVRKAMSGNVDKIHGDHQMFHEAFVKRDIMKKLGAKDNDTSKARAKAKAEAIRLLILEMENQRRNHRAQDGEEEDDEQDPDEKVAFWILSQNFSELIDRRKKRLREFTGNILEIKESPYRISEVSEIEDIHALYDELELLAIP